MILSQRDRWLRLSTCRGEVTRHDLLEVAGAGEAKILISAVEDPETARALVQTAQKHFPNLTLMVRARQESRPRSGTRTIADIKAR